MKTIGLIGGMSWESTVTYYQEINTLIKEKLGGLHSGKCLLFSVDFQEIEQCQSQGNWQKAGEILADGARRLEMAGADFLVLCTNTMHKVADQIQAAVKIPLLHIAQATAMELLDKKMTKVALLGTSYTMEQDFYKKELIKRGIDVIIPQAGERQVINDVIFGELCLGIISAESKKMFLKTIEDLKSKGAEGIVLGCTEIGLLIQQKDTAVPLFDTAIIHAQKAALTALDAI